MNLQLIKYRRAFDKLPLAAKSIVLAVVLGLVFVIWYYLFWQNIQDSITTTSAKIKTLEESIPKAEERLKSETSDIKNKFDVLDEGTGATGLLSPRQGSIVLHDLLKNTDGLDFFRLENISTNAVILPQTNLQVFEHGMVIKFHGDYFSTMRYLQSIEKLKWKIFWDALQYKVIHYPIAEVTLYIHTISNEGDWIHV